MHLGQVAMIAKTCNANALSLVDLQRSIRPHPRSRLELLDMVFSIDIFAIMYTSIRAASPNAIPDALRYSQCTVPLPCLPARIILHQHPTCLSLLTEFLRFCSTVSIAHILLPSPDPLLLHLPAAVLFFFGGDLPLDLATFKCSSQSSSFSSMTRKLGYSFRNCEIAPIRGG